MHCCEHPSPCTRTSTGFCRESPRAGTPPYERPRRRPEWPVAEATSLGGAATSPDLPHSIIGSCPNFYAGKVETGLRRSSIRSNMERARLWRARYLYCGSFPLFARLAIASLELTPGTAALHIGTAAYIGTAADLGTATDLAAAAAA